VRAGTSPITLCLSARGAAALAATVFAGLSFGGCGGDDEPTDTTAVETTPPPSVTEPLTTPPPETTTGRGDNKPDPQTEPRTVPQEEQSGDEEAIRSEAVFTGKDGKLTPRVVRVPAFIAVRVILRSPDAGRDQGYTLMIGGERLAIGHVSALAEANLPGLLPNKAYEGRSPQGNVRVVASAEPGP
jgi:hypothetical protein